MFIIGSGVLLGYLLLALFPVVLVRIVCKLIFKGRAYPLVSVATMLLSLIVMFVLLRVPSFFSAIAVVFVVFIIMVIWEKIFARMSPEVSAMIVLPPLIIMFAFFDVSPFLVIMAIASFFLVRKDLRNLFTERKALREQSQTPRN